MKIRLKFKNSFRTKNDFSLKIFPALWLIHKSTENQRKFAENHNKKSKSKVMYDYTSICLDWLFWGITFKFGKQ